MEQARHTVAVATPGQGLYDVTVEIPAWLAAQTVRDGLLTAFVRHTTASLVVQENVDPDVLSDLRDFFARLAPEDDARYRHRTEGTDDMPGHIKGALLPVQLSVPVSAGRMALGTWQGVYLFEHRNAPRRREIALHLIGE